MPNTNDIDLQKLTLNSTFYDWYIRTNQIIDYINPINVYDVFAGSGLQESRTGTPGTVEISLGTNPTNYGIDTLTDSNGDSITILNIAGLTTGTVTNTSTFAFGGTTSKSVLRKVAASDMLPPTINGNHLFTGTITVGDLVVRDGTIILNDTGSTRDNVGFVIESTADTATNNVSFLFDTDTNAWYSNRNLGMTSGRKFVTNAIGSAVYPFYASNSQATVDIQLQTNIGVTLEAWSIKGAWGSPDTLKFGHYTNGVLNQEVLELQSFGTNNSRVIVKDAITITDLLNSSPFSQSPTATSVPITDSTNGYLSTFVNRIKAPTALVTGDVGRIVRINGSGNAVSAVADSEANSQTIGILESVSAGTATIITGGICPISPRDNTGSQITMTSGTVYYLHQSVAGAVQATKPSSGFVKPILIATSTTQCVYVSDFYYAAGTNAFTSVQVVDTGETYTASASGTTLRLDGGNSIALDYTTNGTIVFNYTGTQLPTGVANNSFYIKNNAGTNTALTPSTYSLVGQPLNAGLADIPVAPGTLVGRRDDTDDSNNPVEALLPSQVRSILGFSGNRYIKSILFEESASTDIILFDANNSESVKVRAGFGIDFTYDSVEKALVITNTGGGTGGGGGPSTLDIFAAGGGSATDVGSIRFLNSDSRNYIDFTVEENTSAVASIVAKPKNTFLKFNDNILTVNHDAGDTLRILGSGGVDPKLATSGSLNTLTISLLSTINTNTIQSTTNTVALDTNSPKTLSFKVVDSATVGGGYNANDLDFTATIETYASLSSIASQTRFDSTAYPTFTNPSSQNICVSVFADKVIGPNIISYPFRFYKIIADKIEVADIEITGIAIKDYAEISTLSGTAITDTGRTLNKIKVVDNDLTQGVLLRFETDSNSSNDALLIKPSSSFTGSIPSARRNKSFILTEKIFFGNNTLTQFTPSIGVDVDNAGSILIQSDSSQSKFRLLDSGNRECSVGVQSGYAFLSYDPDSTGPNAAVSMRISSNTIINNADSFAVGIDATKGWKINTVVYSSGDIGKGMRISGVTNGVATLEARDYIKPYVVGTTSGDLVNTLYYVV